MVELLKEHLFLTGLVWFGITVFLFILMINYYRKKKCYENVITSLIGNDEAVFELCKEAAKLEKHDVKAHIIGTGEKGQVSEAGSQAKTHKKDTKSERKKAEILRMMDKRLESIIKLAQINRSQILNDLSKG